MFVTDIEALGLTAKEAAVYLTSLRVGPASMQVLARKAKVDRGTAYHVAKTLEEKGLFKQVRGGARPLFAVLQPGKLYGWVEEQKREADAHYAAVQVILDDLEELYAVAHPAEA